MPSSSSTLRYVYTQLTSEDDGRVCRDIPESACHHQPRNFLLHILSLAGTKTADGLLSPKIVLAWLITALGAPAALVGFLVPVREAGSLLPQLFVAARIRSLPQRKWVWSLGSLVQGLCVAGMAVTAVTMEGGIAGWLIIGLLAVLALARSLCSISYKDVLGKTVSKATRGTATGSASTIAASAVLLFGLALFAELVPRTPTTIAAVLLVAAGLWITAAALFTLLLEESGATQGGGNPVRLAISQCSMLWQDRQLAWFVTTRGLLLATALAPPFMLTLGSPGQIEQLGGFIVAGAAAALLSAYAWGRLADRSSRRVLIYAALLGCLALAGAALATTAGFTSDWLIALLFFVLMIAYEGVRLGRATHIVDMASADNRAAYTAVSNTTIGVLLLLGGGFSLVAASMGSVAVIACFAVMCALAAATATRLTEVQSA
ncbi:MAG: MFS transporter [Salinisphaeraceae bacterium]|nr:MFS transporter [Salinisphaeraceae bacterium]